MAEKNIWIWMDMEMTGLEPDRHHILEIATIATTPDLEIISEGPELCISQPDSALGLMDEWCVSHHTASGLISRVKSSGVELVEAEKQILTWAESLCKAKTSPLCGNSIHQDRRFLVRHAPTLENFFHYRNLDVSTIKILAQNWLPTLPQYKKQGSHRALDDIRESIGELKYYRTHMFGQTHSERTNPSAIQP